MPALANTLRRWNATVRGDTQICAATSLFDSPVAHQLCDLQLHRRQVTSVEGHVCVLSRRRRAVRRSRVRRAGLRAGRRTSPAPCGGARGSPLDVGRGAATLRRRDGSELRRKGDRPARTGSAPRRTASRCLDVASAVGCGVGGHRAAVGVAASAHGRPVALRTRRGRRPTSSQVRLSGSDRSVDPVRVAIRAAPADAAGERWWSAPKASPAAAACTPFAHRIRSCTGSVRMPNGYSATTSSTSASRVS